MMVPVQVTVVPLYLLMNELGLLDRPVSLILPGLTAAFGVFLMRQFFITIPEEILDAARVDGAGPWRTYRLIALPLAKGPMAALGHHRLPDQLERLLSALDPPPRHRHRRPCPWPSC